MCCARDWRHRPWVSVDDTGARHKAKNGFCTQIGNDWFTWFGTRSAKSRLNFLDLLRAGHTDYVLNEAAFDYLRNRGLPGPLITRLTEAGETHFADQPAWQAHLDRLGIVSPAKSGLAVIQDPVTIATEGAQWGSIQAHGFLHDAVVLSDDAGQFDIGLHALCWVHAERLVHKLEAFTDLHRAAQQRMRKPIWDFYADLKVYRLHPSQSRRLALRAVRSHLPPPHRLCHARSPAGTAACQQGRVAAGAGSPRDPATYQRLGERYPLPGHPPQGQRRNPQRRRARLP